MMAGARAPEDLDQFLVAARFEVRSYVRTYRFYGIVGLCALASLIASAYLLDVGSAGVRAEWGTLPEFLAAWTGYSGTLAVLSAALLGGDAISAEFGTPAGYFSLVQPVRRSTLLLGRFLAAFLVSAGAVSIFFFTIVALGALLFGGVVGATAVAYGLVLLLQLAFLGLVFLLSAAFRRPTIGIIVIVLLLYLVFPIANLALESAHIESWFLLSYAEGAISQAFVTSPHITEVGAGRGNATLTLTIYTPSLAQGAGIMVGYFVAGVGGALALFSHKEVSG
ncbi:MAG: ABC transporter permease [Thermoplasmata archaeon]|nr:ABC transporter permease [Thermoplasmata archaeon]